MPRPISRTELARRIETGSVVVVEALGPDFFADGHLPQAVNVPHSSPDRMVRRIIGAPGRPVVVYGTRTGDEAKELAVRIEALCPVEVLIYDGGKEDWAEAGLRIDRPGGS